MEIKEENNTTKNIELKQENNVEKINDNKKNVIYKETLFIKPHVYY